MAISNKERTNIPAFIQLLRDCQEAKDALLNATTSKFVQHEYSVQQQQQQQGQQSDPDKIYEKLKQRESEEKTPPFHHDIITFNDNPGWKIDRYHFGALGAKTYFVYRIFRPDGKIYDTLVLGGLESDEILGFMDHDFYEDKEADKSSPIKIGKV